MKKIPLLSFLLLLTACSALPLTRSAQQRMKNPLYAQQYYAELVDHFVNLQVQADLALQDATIAAKVNRARREALQQSQEAAAIVNGGSTGTFNSIREETRGTALALEDSLYISPDFMTVPGGTLRVFVTRAVDPRDSVFPDETAVDLGPLETPYGDQVYALPLSFKGIDQFTVVIEDTMIKRIHGFAQLRP